MSAAGFYSARGRSATTLERVAFKTNRLGKFVGRRELTAQIGHPPEWTGLTIGGFAWRDNPERVELPFNISVPNPEIRADIEADLLASVRRFASTLLNGEMQR
jgi:hypothetical protein